MKSETIGLMPRSDLQITISETLVDSEWDVFVAGSESGHHVQTSLWAQVKNVQGWTPLRMIIKDPNGIIAGLQMLIRSYPLLGKIGYVTKGPVYLNEDPKLIQILIDSLIKESNSRKIRILAVQPPNNGYSISSLLATAHFQQSSLELAPTASVLIDLTSDEEKIFSQIHKATRSNIRFGLKRGIAVREVSGNHLDIFYHLYCLTSQRQNFLPFPVDYLRKMQQVFEPINCFQLLLAEYHNQPVAALILIAFRDTVVSKVHGWSGQYSELKPNDVLYWAAIQWAKQHGYHYFDFDDVDREGARFKLEGLPLPIKVIQSPDLFKYKFGGKIHIFPEAYDKIFSPPHDWVYHKLNLHQGNNHMFSKMVDFFRKR